MELSEPADSFAALPQPYTNLKQATVMLLPGNAHQGIMTCNPSSSNCCKC